MASSYTYAGSSKRKTFFLITFFLVFIIALGWVFSRALGVPWLLPAAVIFSVVQSFVSYWWSDKIALAVSGATEADRGTYPDLYRSVELVSISAGLPMPKVYVIDDTAPNAFATGRDPNHAAVAVTTGILQKLDSRQLEAVLAHEFAHIGNYDIRLSTVVVVLVGIVALISDWFLRISFYGGDDDGDKNPYLMIAGLVLALLSPLFAMLIQLAISRKRELLADATSAQIYGRPNKLAEALKIISEDTEPLEVANKATAHLYIADPIKDHSGARSWFAGLFNTHPPVEERIEKLMAMQYQTPEDLK